MPLLSFPVPQIPEEKKRPKIQPANQTLALDFINNG
jgi:hypothetical protein